MQHSEPSTCLPAVATLALHLPFLGPSRIARQSREFKVSGFTDSTPQEEDFNNSETVPSCLPHVTSRHDQQPRDNLRPPATSFLLVPKTNSNESHTRSDELPARSRHATQRVSHSSDELRARSIPDSQPTVAITRGQATTVLSEHHNKEHARHKTQQRSATMFAVYLLCVLRATFVHARTRQWAVRTHR